MVPLWHLEVNSESEHKTVGLPISCFRSIRLPCPPDLNPVPFPPETAPGNTDEEAISQENLWVG